MPSSFATARSRNLGQRRPRGHGPGRFLLGAWAAFVLAAWPAESAVLAQLATAPATSQLATNLRLPPGISPEQVSIAILACDHGVPCLITDGPPHLDADGTLTASYTMPSPSAQILIRLTYPDGPERLDAPLRTILLTQEPGRLTAPLPFGPSPTAPGHASLPLIPSEHGFRFVNHFTASPLPMLEKTLGFKLDAFGLCGGMSFATADLFLASRPRPEAVAPPPSGSPLYDYIYGRQVDSLGGLAIQGARFALWMDLPTGTIAGTNKRSYDELAAARAALDAGQPVVLGLVYVGAEDRKPAWNNHQVLAFAYQSTGAGELSFRIYDPNYPGRDDVTIRATERTEGQIDDPTRPGNTIPILGIECRQWLGHKDLRPIRGLFVMPYTPTPPPPNLSSIPRTNNSTPAPSR